MKRLSKKRASVIATKIPIGYVCCLHCQLASYDIAKKCIEKQTKRIKESNNYRKKEIIIQTNDRVKRQQSRHMHIAEIIMVDAHIRKTEKELENKLLEPK